MIEGLKQGIHSHIIEFVIPSILIIHFRSADDFDVECKQITCNRLKLGFSKPKAFL